MSVLRQVVHATGDRQGTFCCPSDATVELMEILMCVICRWGLVVRSLLGVVGEGLPFLALTRQAHLDDRQCKSSSGCLARPHKIGPSTPEHISYNHLGGGFARIRSVRLRRFDWSSGEVS